MGEAETWEKSQMHAENCETLKCTCAYNSFLYSTRIIECWINFPLHSGMLICYLIRENVLNLIQKRILHSFITWVFSTTWYTIYLFPCLFHVSFLLKYKLPETRSFVLLIAVFPKPRTMLVHGRCSCTFAGCLIDFWINYIIKYLLHAWYYMNIVNGCKYQEDEPGKIS